MPGKVFARIILDRVRHHSLEHQHPEQSGFTPKRSAIEHILAICVLPKCRGEFWQGLLAAHVDLCKAFDSVNWDALWKILGLLEDLGGEIYFGPESAVRCGDTISNLFPVATGVCQRCVLAPTL